MTSAMSDRTPIYVSISVVVLKGVSSCVTPRLVKYINLGYVSRPATLLSLVILFPAGAGVRVTSTITAFIIPLTTTATTTTPILLLILLLLLLLLLILTVLLW